MSNRKKEAEEKNEWANEEDKTGEETVGERRETEAN